MALVATLITLPLAAAGIAAAVYNDQAQDTGRDLRQRTRVEEEDDHQHHQYDQYDQFDQYEDGPVRRIQYDQYDQYEERAPQPSRLHGDFASPDQLVGVAEEGEEGPSMFTAFDEVDSSTSSMQAFDDPDLKPQMQGEYLGTHDNGIETYDVYSHRPRTKPDYDGGKVMYDLDDHLGMSMPTHEERKSYHTKGLKVRDQYPQQIQQLMERRMAEERANDAMVGHLDGYGKGMRSSWKGAGPGFRGGYKEIDQYIDYHPWNPAMDLPENPRAQARANQQLNNRRYLDHSQVLRGRGSAITNRFKSVANGFIKPSQQPQQIFDSHQMQPQLRHMTPQVQLQNTNLTQRRPDVDFGPEEELRSYKNPRTSQLGGWTVSRGGADYMPIDVEELTYDEPGRSAVEQVRNFSSASGQQGKHTRTEQINPQHSMGGAPTTSGGGVGVIPQHQPFMKPFPADTTGTINRQANYSTFAGNSIVSRPASGESGYKDITTILPGTQAAVNSGWTLSNGSALSSKQQQPQAEDNQYYHSSVQRPVQYRFTTTETAAPTQISEE